MKSLYKSLVTWFLCLFLVLSNFIVSFADVKSLMISSDSNALMTLELDDSDYTVMPISSLGSVTNTLSSSRVPVQVMYLDGSGSPVSRVTYADLTNGRYKFYYEVPEGCKIYQYTIQLWNYNKVIPSPGDYYFSYDLSSDFSIDYTSDPYLYVNQIKNNVANKYTRVNPDMLINSGDVYLNKYAVTLGSLYSFYIVHDLDYSDSPRYIGGSFSIRFEDSGISGVALGTDTSSADYESGVSSSLSDLSSSVDSMTEDLSSAAENLEYISTSQNLIIQGIDNVVMHISDQLFAFWNQLFNLIHVPTMAKMDDIIDAINNMDLEIEVNLDGLKSTINNMSTAVQNKLQSVTNTITGGFDNSGIEQNGNELDSSITEFEEAEQNVLESVNESLNDFEFDADLSEYKNIVQVISDFLQELYDSSGGFKLVINLSLMLSVASIVIGVYRFKEGG